MPFIEIRGTARNGYFTKIKGKSFVVGRDIVCDLKLDDGRTSRKHCEVFYDDAVKKWKVRDLGSSNGTLLNGKPVKEGDLADGAEIGLGASVLIFLKSAPTGSQRRKPAVLEIPVETPAEPTIREAEKADQVDQRGAAGKTVGPSSSAARLDTLMVDRAALINAEAGQSQDRSTADLRCLFGVARACSAARTPEAVLAALGEKLSARLEADRLYVFLGAGTDRVAWSAADADFAADPGKVPVSNTVIDRALDDNVAVLMTEPGEDQEFAAAKSIEVNKIVTALAAPLSAGGRPVGVLYADRLGRGESFSNQDLELAAAAGLLAAGSLAGAEELARARAALGEGDMLGQSEAIEEVRQLIVRAAPADAVVLVTGESGTGKELVARGLHAASNRANKPFEVVNCAALAENLIESELFGHAKGAFTGASSERIGRFELADGGMLFLDEIGELSSGAQAKLLRVLEQGELSRVGESKVRKVDVRVIAATNRDLEAEVAGKKFRQDLYYRLNVLRIPLPPLKARAGDVELLLEHFLESAAARMGKAAPQLDGAARQKLLAYSWPGNVREMKNLAERLVILSGGGAIEVADLPSEIGGVKIAAATAAGSPVGGQVSLNDLMKEHILAVLASVGNNKSKAADVLGIDRSTLYARLKEYGGE
jgi:two-component system, NtrC family, response regulator HydG